MENAGPPSAHIDFETANALELKRAGIYRQVEHPSMRVWMLSWWMNTGPRGRWHPGDPDPVELLDHIRGGGRVVCHNAGFERTVWNGFLLTICPHWPRLTIAQQDCTMSRCSVLSIPAGLDFAADVLGIPYRKDAEGYALMLRMARPRTKKTCWACDGHGRFGPIHGGGPCVVCEGAGQLYTWWDDTDRIARLGDYCDQDTVVEGGVDEKVLPLSTGERAVWELDQVINDRGVKLDMRSVRRALAIVKHAKGLLNAEMSAVTEGIVKTCTDLNGLKAWIHEQGVPCTTVAKDDHDDLMLAADAADKPAVRRAVELRQQAGKASTSKLKAMDACVCADDRARGLLFYHGAHPGRWAGRLIQPQNLHRVQDNDVADVAQVIEILHTIADPAVAHDTIAAVVGDPMVWLAKTMRQMFVAEDGKRFIGGDLANIEGRFNAWLSGEDWKLEAFRAYDAGIGQDLYKLAYARSFGCTVEEVTGPQRQIGKVEELALGYQGGVGAFINMGVNYGLVPAQIVPIVRDATDPALWGAMIDDFKGARDKFDLPADEWAALKLTVKGWRSSHPKLVQGWWDLQDAAIEAVTNPGHVTHVFGGRVQYVSSKGFLWCMLPSTRLLAYARPRVVQTRETWYELPNGQRFDTEGQPQEYIDYWLSIGQIIKLESRPRKQVLYEGYSSEKKRWGIEYLYGGKQCENICQAGARDVLVGHEDGYQGGMFEAERLGYELVLTVHDELLTEVKIGYGSAQELREIMSKVPSWAPGLPLAAKTFEDTRYSK